MKDEREARYTALPCGRRIAFVVRVLEHMAELARAHPALDGALDAVAAGIVSAGWSCVDDGSTPPPLLSHELSVLGRELVDKTGRFDFVNARLLMAALVVLDALADASVTADAFRVDSEHHELVRALHGQADYRVVHVYEDVVLTGMLAAAEGAMPLRAETVRAAFVPEAPPPRHASTRKAVIPPWFTERMARGPGGLTKRRVAIAALPRLGRWLEQDTTPATTPAGPMVQDTYIVGKVKGPFADWHAVFHRETGTLVFGVEAAQLMQFVPGRPEIVLVRAEDPKRSNSRWFAERRGLPGGEVLASHEVDSKHSRWFTSLKISKAGIARITCGDESGPYSFEVDLRAPRQ